MSRVADQLYKPFGLAECGLLSDDEYDRNPLPSAGDTPKRIIRVLEQLRDDVCNGTYVIAESSLNGIVDACQSFKFPSGLSAIMGPGCKDGVNSAVVSCLPLAVIQHVNYSRDALYEFAQVVAKYAYIAITVKSFCFEVVDDDTTSNLGRLTKENLDYISDLSTGIKAINAFRLWPRRWRRCPTINFDFPTAYQCPIRPVYVEAIANALYKSVENKLTKHGWTGRHELHKQIVDNTVGNLSAMYDRYTFYALAFLPYNDDSQQCVESIPRSADSGLTNASQTNLNFFVRHASKVDDHDKSRSTLNSTWQTTNSKRSAILDNLFDDNSEKMCKRLALVLFDVAEVNLEAHSGVGAFAAIKCGYHFVWYELAYTYFPAAATNSPYIFESERNSKYNANCGQLILFA